MAASDEPWASSDGWSVVLAAAERLKPLRTLYESIGGASHRPLRARQLVERALSEAQALLPADSLIMADLFYSAECAFLMPLETQLLGDMEAMRLLSTNPSERVLELSNKAVALLRGRLATGSLFTLTPEESAWFFPVGHSGDAMAGAGMLLNCAFSAASSWPHHLPPLQQLGMLTDCVSTMLQVQAQGFVARCAASGRRILRQTVYKKSEMQISHLILHTLTPNQRSLLFASVGHPGELLVQQRAAVDPRQMLTMIVAALSDTVQQVQGRHSADVARHGLQRCTLPSCGAEEPHPKAFKVCSRCRTCTYCSAEHAAEDWKRHKRAECAKKEAVQ